MELTGMYEQLGISEKVLKFARETEAALKERFEEIDGAAEYNQLKVIQAMQEARVSDIHFAGTTGYGYNDLGRDTLEEVYARAFHGEDALVRPQLICGTHALTVALSGNLRPGDETPVPGGKALRYPGGGHRHPGLRRLLKGIRRHLPPGGSACPTAALTMRASGRPSMSGRSW